MRPDLCARKLEANAVLTRWPKAEPRPFDWSSEEGYRDGSGVFSIRVREAGESGGNKALAMRLYEWKTGIFASFWESRGHAEVALRNHTSTSIQR
jgi:hypothetical protein